MLSAAIIPFRPAALPAIGYRVDVHLFDGQALVILFQHRTIASQKAFQATSDADAYARDLAGDHGCSVIHHDHRADFVR